jgi:hypothetical protein
VDFLRHIRIAAQDKIEPGLNQTGKSVEWCFTTSTYGNEDTMADFRSAILQAGYTEDENYKIYVALGGCTVSFVAYEVANKSPLQLRQFTSSTNDACG